MNATMARHTLAASTFVIVVASGCVTTDELAPPVSAEMIAYSSARGTDADTLERGRLVYLTSCTACHSPEPVTAYPAPAWPAILDRMAPLAALDGQQRADVEAYVIEIGAHRSSAGAVLEP